MKTISLSNWKGGSFKTTTTANLGAFYAKQGLKVLLIDLDPQFNLSQAYHMVGTEEEPIETVFDTLINKKPLPIYEIQENLFISPSGFNMIGIDKAFSSVLMGAEKRLINAIEKLDFDICLIDCPPSLNILTINAYVASDYILAPVQPETLSYKGVIHLEEQLNEMGVNIDYIFLGRYNERKKLNFQVSIELKKRFEDRLLDSKIRECIQIAEAPINGQSVFDYAPESNGTEDYKNLGLELSKKINIELPIKL